VVRSPDAAGPGDGPMTARRALFRAWIHGDTPNVRSSDASPGESTHVLSAEMLAQHGISLCHKTVARLLREHGCNLQAPNKSVEGNQHPDRNAQFEHINAKAQDCRTSTGRRRAQHRGPRKPLPAWYQQVEQGMSKIYRGVLRMFARYLEMLAGARRWRACGARCASGSSYFSCSIVQVLALGPRRSLFMRLMSVKCPV